MIDVCQDVIKNWICHHVSPRALSQHLLQELPAKQFAMDTPSAMAGEKRKRDGATTPAPKLGVVRVEKATTGR